MTHFKYLTLAAFALSLPLTMSDTGSAQTTVAVSIGNESAAELAPRCDFPCDPNFELPLFARVIALAGPEGRYRTKLTRPAFRRQLEDWRAHMELFRRSIEHDLKAAPDWNAANVTYLVHVGKYRQFVQAYRAAIAMERAGTISYAPDGN